MLPLAESASAEGEMTERVDATSEPAAEGERRENRENRKEVPREEVQKDVIEGCDLEDEDTEKEDEDISAVKDLKDEAKDDQEDKQEMKTKDEGNPADESKGKILKTVRAMLKEAGSKFYTDLDRNLIRMTATGRHAAYNVIFDAKEDKSLLFVYVLCSNLVPEDRRAAMAEFMARANWGLAIGNFELNMNDGEMRYKVSIDVEEGELSCVMVRNMLGASTQTVERYFPGMMAVCYAGKNAAQAVAEAEGSIRFMAQ